MEAEMQSSGSNIRTAMNVFAELRRALLLAALSLLYLLSVIAGVLQLLPDASALGASTGAFVGLLCGAFLVLLLASISRLWRTKRASAVEVAQLIAGIPALTFGSGGVLDVLSSGLSLGMLSSYVLALVLIAGPLSLPPLLFMSYRAGIELLRGD